MDALHVRNAIGVLRKQRLHALITRLGAELYEMEACELSLAAALLDNALAEVEREISQS